MSIKTMYILFLYSFFMMAPIAITATDGKKQDQTYGEIFPLWIWNAEKDDPDLLLQQRIGSSIA
jgi:hypothetical protein